MQHKRHDVSADGLPALKRWSLRFIDEDWDDRYRGALRESNLSTLRAAMMIAIGLNLIFVPQDFFFYPENAVTIALWRGIGMTLLFVVLLAASYRPFWRTRWPALLMVMVIGYTVFQAVANVYGGHFQPVDHGFILMVFIIYAMLPFFYIQAVNAALLCTALYLGITIWGGWPHADLQQVSYSIVLILASNLIGFVALRRMELLRRRGFASNELVAEERARVRELLDRILPASVATRLREGETRVVERLADVTVLFADIEGFTSMASECQPEETLDTLSDAFDRFDKLVVQHGVEKIKTIGDAYMVAAGAPAGSKADARQAAALSLDMIRVVRDLKRPDGSALHIRIGVARGPIIAGVVGDSRFLYDLWGDAVNTASRMETTGAADRIQVTREVVDALEGLYDFEPRGEVEVKGKGRMPTWWLTGPCATSAAAE
ncbi:adenylate/guanylate cyclase domain-containing protein [Minwuia sp.]|uniref:adenylate/guanylate cyclase domain-containing protein n=1 Tax=Minwuia sp. TaxID=2493630 RepID=UPI003A9285A7